MSAEKLLPPVGKTSNLNRAGRKPGVPNKMNGQIKDMILGALERAGGEKYLARQANENPAAFMTLVGKVLPLQLTGEGGGAISHSLKVEFVRSDGSSP